MSNPARKNYGKDKLKEGDIVYVYGESKTPFRVKKIEHYGSVTGQGTVDRLVLNTTWGGTTIQSPENLKLAPDQAEERERFNAIRKDAEDRRKAEREAIKDRDALAKAELLEFAEFCNQNPATALNGEMWTRLRALSDHASCVFANAEYKVPFKWL